MNTAFSDQSEKSARYCNDGFTVLEMLVGLSITALLAALMVATLSQIRPLVRHVTLGNDQSELFAVADYLEALLKQTRKLPLREDNPNRKSIFIGEGHKMRFVSVARVGSNRAVLRDVELNATVLDRKWRLVQTTTPRRSDRVDPEKPATIVEELETIRFEYLAPDGNEPAEWTENWTKVDEIPTAIKLVLRKASVANNLDYQRVIIVRHATR